MPATAYRALLLITLATCLCSGPAEALRFYVDQTTGDDRRSHIVATESETPWQSITHAISMAEIITEGRPHVIHLAPGTYSSSSGETLPLVIRQTDIYLESSGRVILDGESVSQILRITAPTPDFVLRDVTLTNGRADRGGAVYCETCSLRVAASRLLENVSADGGDAIYVDSGRLQMTNTSVRRNGDSSPGGSVIEVRNTFEDLTQRDVIRNNTFYLNNTPAILTTGNRTDISNNIFVGNAGNHAPAIVDSAVGVDPMVRYNLFWDTDILYLADDGDSIKVLRTVRETLTLEDQGISLPAFVTKAPDTSAAVGSLYEVGIEVEGDRSAYVFSIASEGDVPEAMWIQDGTMRWTPMAADVGRHALRVKIVDPDDVAGFLSFVLHVFTPEEYPGPTTPVEQIIVSLAPDTAGAVAALNEVVPAFSGAATVEGNDYGNPLFVNASINRFELNAGSPARDTGNPIVAMFDAVTYGSAKFNDMGSLGGPATAGPPDPGTHTEIAITTIPDTLAIEGVAWVYDPTYAIPEGEQEQGILLVELVQGPPTMGDALGSRAPVPVAWVPTAADSGSFVVGLKTYLEDGRSGRHFFPLRVRAANVPPRVVSTPPTTAAEDVELVYTVRSVDEDGHEVSYSLQSGPEGMSVDAGGLVRWTPAQTDIGTVAVVILLTDSGGATNTHAFNLQVTNTNDAPVLAPLVDVEAAEDLPFALALSASDVDPGSTTFTYTLLESPTGLQISGDVLSWTPAQADVGEHLVTVQVSDGEGGLDSGSFTITVTEVDDPPTITSAPPTTALEDQAYTYTVVGVDEEGQPLTFSLLTAPQGMSIDAEGVIRWTPVLADIGEHPIAVQISDPGDLTAVQSFTVQVTQVNDPPLVVSRSPEAERVLVEPGKAVQLTVVATDEEGAAITYQWLVNRVVRGTNNRLLVVPGGVDTVVVNISDGVSTISLTWIVDGRVAPRIAVATEAIDFGSVAIGAVGSVILPVENTGRAALEITDLRFAGAFAAQFAEITIAVDGATTLEVRFEPDRRGARAGTIEFTTNDPDVPEVTIPVLGTGLVPTKVVLDLDPATGDQGRLSGTARAGKDVNIDLEATDALELASFAVELSFDTSVLSYADYLVDGHLLGDDVEVAADETIAGQLRIEVTAAGLGLGVSGDGNLGRVLFTVAPNAEAGSTTTIQLERVELRSAGLSIDDVLTAISTAVVEIATSLVGDFDGDSTVGLDDFFLFAEAYGTTQALFDLDGDGRVGLDDFFLFAEVLGTTARPVPVVDGAPGLELSVDPRPEVSDLLTARLLWHGDAPLHGGQLSLRYDPRHLVFLELATAADPPSLVWSASRGPGATSLIVMRTRGAAFDTEVGTLHFRRRTAAATEVRLEAARGRLAGISVGLLAPPPAMAAALPRTAVLFPPHPNPFNPETVIPLFVPDDSDGDVEVRIYDLLGRPVRDLATDGLAAGHHRLVWRGRDDDGWRVGAGVYLVELRATEARQVRKVLLLK